MVRSCDRALPEIDAIAQCRDYGANLKLQSLHFLARVCPAQGGVYYLVDDNLNCSDYAIIGIDSKVHEDYLSHYGEVDPLHARHYVHSDRNIITKDGLAAGLQRKWEVYINEFLKPGGLNHIMEIFLRDESRIIAGLSLTRSESCKPFTASEISMVERVRAYIEFNSLHFRQLHASLNADPLREFKQSLSRQEARVFELLCRGACNKEISRRLFIQECTTKTHLRHIYAKFSVENRQELLALVLSRGSSVSRQSNPGLRP